MIFKRILLNNYIHFNKFTLKAFNQNYHHYHHHYYTFSTSQTSQKPQNKKQFTNAQIQIYIQQYKNLIIKNKLQQNQIHSLRQNVQKLQDIATITLSDRVKRSLLSILGIKYQSKKVEQQKLKLKNYRDKLQKTIAISQQKWQQPRNLILENRQKINQQFLQSVLEIQSILQELKTFHVHQQLIEAAQLNHRLLIKTMEKNRSYEIKPQVGQQFDETMHQCCKQDLKTLENKNLKSLQIQQVIQKGWKIQDKIIKKSKVRVKSNQK